MKLLRNLLPNFLLGLNVFILFFLLFEGRIAIPAPLQVLGRMHPLLLHFPIVVLILALVFELFSRHIQKEAAPGQARQERPGQGGLATPLQEYSQQKTPGQKAVGLLLYVGAISAALTVVFGLLLSKEEGYSGETLNWHKWTGVAISFFSALLLWCQKEKMVRPAVFRVGMALTCLVLLVAGHLGASLTHGENFVLQPVLSGKEKQVDLATAVVFPDLVLPVLEEKCFSCHNPDKAKGELILTDTAGILAGGENGTLFQPGDPAASLLMERLLLDIEHEDHMPPKNKPQLTAEEIGLVQAWIYTGGHFNVPLAALPPTDTIHQLARHIYKAAPPAEKFDFPPPDAGLVEELNTAYRVIAPLADGSPALDVSFFNASFFNSESLQGLKPISQQIVHLNLSDMPLEAADFELLKSFTNLRQLNLNYAPVTDKELQAVAQLPQLRSLMLTGTKITPAGLDLFADKASLRHLYVWNTEITAENAAEWTARRPALAVETGFYDDGSMILPLNNPEMKPAKAFFREAFTLQLTHPINGTQLHYTLDGTEPDSLNAPVFKEPLPIAENTLVKVKAYKEGWIGSETVQTFFYKARFRPDSTRLALPPDPQYKGRGAMTLFDMDNGSGDIRDGKWLGYRAAPLEVYLQFKEPLALSEVAISAYLNTRGHIFPPVSIEIWGGITPDKLELLGKTSPETLAEHQPAANQIYRCSLKGTNLSYLRVSVKPLDQLPNWHGAKGQAAWVFVDEILLN